jgi:protein transport protein SEC39
MADSSPSPAKVILLAVQFAIKAEIAGLRALVDQHRKTFRTDIILRIILTYLPESLESSHYVPFLEDLTAGKLSGAADAPIDYTPVDEISNEDATRKVRKLHLLPLAWPSAPPDAPDDPFILFLIHRAYKVDEQTGLITQVLELIVPFLDRSQYLRSWMISTILPLVRLNYEYHPQESAVQTLEAFEALDDWSGVNYLLSRTGKTVGSEGENSKMVGRDLRGLIGPWMYGDTQWRRQRLRKISDFGGQIIEPLNEPEAGEDSQSASWNEVFKWIVSHATTSWNTCVEAIEQWDGPGDVDLGGYGNGANLHEEHEQQELGQRYARAALAAAYLIPEASVEALTGVQRILARLIIRLDLERIPTLSAAATLLAPVSVDHESLNTIGRSATHLRTGLMEEKNFLTTPRATSIILLHGLLVSAYLLTHAGVPCTIRRAGELVLLQDEREQTFEVQRLIHKIGNGPKGDDKYWIRMRNEVLWLRDWGADELSGTKGHIQGRGIFGKVKKDFLEMEILKALLVNTRELILPLTSI